ncbi:ornithine carbamoyltransferase [Amycolatopsis anabasis]|uniref:ornithine carbamoyltransferase n=1 Tax=Amycolatopsis anabasis TaxID=1840409 RepID=UPI00131D0A96|nr:ornithine carbamoyltransferase [Amycolatopsis anabasis]
MSYRYVDADEREKLLKLAVEFATAPDSFRGILDGRSVGLLFSAPSTRTRTSFWRAAGDLGADVISYGPGDLQLSTGETWADTGRVLSEYLDAVVIRTNGPLDDMRTLAEHLPSTINALSIEEHPTQAIADYCALYEHFGKVEGTRLAYFGEGNNTAAALALLLTRIPGVRCDFYCPPGFGLDEATAALAGAGADWGSRFRMFDKVPDDPDPVDVVYTTRWESMGTKRGSADWRAAFAPFSVTAEVFARFAEPGRTVLMHDLPATRGEEVADDVLDADYSIVRRQAYHKRTAAGAALLWSLGLVTD